MARADAALNMRRRPSSCPEPVVHAGYHAGQALSQPYYGLADTIGDVPQAVTYDTIPLDEVAITTR